jgi:hypothetical protein
MGAFLYAECACGRTLRATPDQAGTVIRCWSCGGEVVVPHPDRKELLIRAMGDAAFNAFGLPTVGFLLAGAVIITAVLLVPRAGPWLALVLVAAASAWGYGGQLGAGAPEPGPAPRGSEVSTVPHASEVETEAEAEDVRGPRRPSLARGTLALAASLALVAPLLVRNRGHTLPPAGAAPGVLGLMALAFVGWLVFPVAMLTAYARDDRSPLPPRRALARLARHPLLTLAALLIVPLGLLATEALVAALAWEQGQLPLIVADLFPPPRLVHMDDGPRLCFDLDGTEVVANCGGTHDTLIPVYRYGLRRGFTLIGTIPASLSIRGVRILINQWMFKVAAEKYLATRIALTFLVAWAAGTLLTIQARWLGLIATLDSV